MVILLFAMMTGIAGFGSGQIYLPAKGVHEFIDFHGKTPAAARPDMWSHLIEGRCGIDVMLP